MANINAKFGLRPIGRLGSSYNSTGTTEYDILTGTTGSIFTGDPVKWLAQAALPLLLLAMYYWESFKDAGILMLLAR